MSRLAINTTFYTQLDAQATIPQLWVDIKFDGLITEELQTNDQSNTQGYVSGVNVLSLTDSAAQIELPATPERIADMIDGTWRDGTCTIYAMQINASTGNTVLSGTINSVAYGGNSIQVEILATNLLGKFTPVYTYDSFAHYMPADGEVMTWDSEPVVAVRKPSSSRGISLMDAIYSNGGTW